MRHKYFILMIYENLKYVNEKLHMKLSQVHDLHHQLENFYQFENFIMQQNMPLKEK
jgi:hypothetical protein